MTIWEEIVDPAKGDRHKLYNAFQVVCTDAIRPLCYDEVKSPAPAKLFKEKSRLPRP
jgi:hypothetical protein